MASDQPVQLRAEMSDRAEAAPLTTERRYGFYWMGCVAATILIIFAALVGAVLVIGIRDAGILLAILLPVLLLAAVMANLFLWWQHRKAQRRREATENEWVSTVTYAEQGQPSAPSDTPRSSGSSSWFRRFSQRASTRSTPPPGYQTVVGT